MLVAFLAIAASFGSVANADIRNASGTNVQEGDNESDVDQDGASASGDAVAGQVIGSVGSGDVSIDATNRSEDVEVETGDAYAENNAATFTGLTAGTSTNVAADILNRNAVNVQEGDNESDINQSASASTGDGVGGQVIGVVTSDPCTCGASVDIVAANTSLDVDIETGDAEAHNDAAAFVGLNASGTVTTAADIFNASATNVQEGDNELDADQDARAASGDGVGGQVLGVVSAGDASVSATNWSEDVDVETGEAYAENDFAAFVGLTAGSATTLDAADHRFPDLFNRRAINVQEGDNEKSVSQDANASSGDAVGGQVAGVVTSAGGSADLVLANTTVDSEAESGEGEFENEDYSFTGLNAGGLIDVF